MEEAHVDAFAQKEVEGWMPNALRSIGRRHGVHYLKLPDGSVIIPDSNDPDAVLPITGFIATLTPAQREAALAYRGDENHGFTDESAKGWYDFEPSNDNTRHASGVDVVLSPTPELPAKKPLVIVESPYAGNVAANLYYARKCVSDSLRRGEAPIASHLLHTQTGILNDNKPEERTLGIEAGLAWYRVADKCVVYADRGMSSGMLVGIERARMFGVQVEMRCIEHGISERSAAA